MAKFAKLFDINDIDQVLVMLSYNHDTEKDEIKLITDIDGVEFRATIEFKKAEDAGPLFETFAHEEAFKFYTRIKKSYDKGDPELLFDAANI